MIAGFAETRDVVILNNNLFRSMGAWTLHRDLHMSSGGGTDVAWGALCGAMASYLQRKRRREGKASDSTSQVPPSQ